jgi:hypothetical protein
VFRDKKRWAKIIQDVKSRHVLIGKTKKKKEKVFGRLGGSLMLIFLFFRLVETQMTVNNFGGRLAVVSAVPLALRLLGAAWQLAGASRNFFLFRNDK